MKNIIILLSLLIGSASYINAQETTDESMIDFTSKAKVKKKEKLNDSPYAMFGDNTTVLKTDHERSLDHSLKIPLLEDDKQIGLFELNFQTGIVTIKNTDGLIVLKQELSLEEVARFLTIDPHAENYYSWSPYAYCANNPMIITDPTGMDWYTDKDGMMQYDPNINKNSKLQEGQTYVGVTHQVTNNKGVVTENYRKDGSIMYANESSAYTRMVTRTGQTGNETMAVLTNKGTLVLPDYKNNSNTVNLKDYGYSTKGGNVVDAMGITHNTLATAHTHPSGGGPSTWDYDNYGDLGFASFATPYKPVYVLQLNGQNAVSFIAAAPNTTNKASGFQYTEYNITRNFPSANVNNLMNGKFKLIPYTRSNNFRSMF